jgi:serine/threonine protein kinase
MDSPTDLPYKTTGDPDRTRRTDPLPYSPRVDKPSSGGNGGSGLIGSAVAHYRIEAKLGQGGMGAVFLALDTKLDRRVAIKVVYAGPLDDQKTAIRFEREARTLARFRHPNLVGVYDVGAVGDLHYFAMEYIEGCTFSHWLKERGRLTPEELFPVAGQILDALSEVHRQGVTHRDLKGGNIMLSGGRAILMDFGLARPEEEAGLTSVGAVLGTPAYMAPEQAAGDPPGPTADIYSFGVIMYEALCGHVPFQGRSAMSIVQKHLTEPPPPLGNRVQGLNPKLAAIVHRCLEKMPSDRFPTCQALALAMAEVLPAPSLLQVAQAVRGDSRNSVACRAAAGKPVGPLGRRLAPCCVRIRTRARIRPRKTHQPCPGHPR